MSNESRAATAEIFAGSFFGKNHAAGVAAGYLHRQAYGDSALSSLLREVRARLHRRAAPRTTNFCAEQLARRLGSRKNVPPHRALRRESVPREPFVSARCRSPRHA